MSKAQEMLDGLVNFASSLGVLGKDKGVATAYTVPVFQPQQASYLYRSSWSGRRVVDIPAGDMVREWRTWAEHQEDFVKEERALGIQEVVRDSIISGKKFGGSAIYLGVGDTDLSKPLDIEKIGKGGLQYILPLERRELSPVEFDTDPLSPRYRRGEIYSINRGSGSNLRIHHSRFAWFGGRPVGGYDRETNQGWDDSVYVGLETLIKNADVAIASLGHLIFESKLDVLKIQDLANHFVDDASEQRLRKRIIAMNYFKSSMNAIVLDSQDDYTQKHSSMAGVSDVAMKSLETLAGAADIPITRFLGQSPGGLNSTGDSDIRNYYDGISSLQETELSPSLRPLDEVLVRHTTGKSLEDISYEWNSLWQTSKKEKTEISKMQAETTQIYNNMGLFLPEFMAQASLNQLKEDDVYPAIESIEEELGDVIELFSEPDGEDTEEEPIVGPEALPGEEEDETEEDDPSDPGKS